MPTLTNLPSHRHSPFSAIYVYLYCYKWAIGLLRACLASIYIILPPSNVCYHHLTGHATSRDQPHMKIENPFPAPYFHFISWWRTGRTQPCLGDSASPGVQMILVCPAHCLRSFPSGSLFSSYVDARKYSNSPSCPFLPQQPRY